MHPFHPGQPPAPFGLGVEVRWSADEARRDNLVSGAGDIARPLDQQSVTIPRPVRAIRDRLRLRSAPRAALGGRGEVKPWFSFAATGPLERGRATRTTNGPPEIRALRHHCHLPRAIDALVHPGLPTLLRPGDGTVAARPARPGLGRGPLCSLGPWRAHAGRGWRLSWLTHAQPRTGGRSERRASRGDSIRRFWPRPYW